MSQEVIESVSKEQLKPERRLFKVGDGVVVHTIIREGDKERVQLFSGIVIARRGSGIGETFTVRRVAAGEGVERIFNVNSPSIAKIEVEHESVPMRAKLYYMRNRIGKSAMQVREKRMVDVKK
ncbi:MAG: 50S ribosomal protein L19 [Puniceicoccales bacterium]|jgi:large subunit ribosomal protein L19|nr:50S ribosomal protein L19 [Puniceicoccales bacterium]